MSWEELYCNLNLMYKSEQRGIFGNMKFEFSLRFFCTVVAPTCNRSVLWECQNFYKPLNSCSGPDLSLGSTGMLKLHLFEMGSDVQGPLLCGMVFYDKGFYTVHAFVKQYFFFFLTGEHLGSVAFIEIFLKLLSFIFCRVFAGAMSQRYLNHF